MKTYTFYHSHNKSKNEGKIIILAGSFGEAKTRLMAYLKVGRIMGVYKPMSYEVPVFLKYEVK